MSRNLEAITGKVLNRKIHEGAPFGGRSFAGNTGCQEYPATTVTSGRVPPATSRATLHLRASASAAPLLARYLSGKGAGLKITG
jgi:hypothetical protein